MLKDTGDSILSSMADVDRGAFIDKLVRATQFWPWMHITDMLDELKSLPVRADSRITAEYLDKVVGSHSSLVRIPPYQARQLLRLDKSPELRNELLQYSFAGWNSAKDYREQFIDEFSKWLG